MTKYQNYIDHIDQRIQSGDSFSEAVVRRRLIVSFNLLAAIKKIILMSLSKTGKNEPVPDNANFMRETFRELGSIRGERREYLENVHHNEPKGLNSNEVAVRAKYWHDEHAQKLLHSIVRLQRGHPQFNVEDVMEDLEEAEDLQLSKSKVKGLLSKFRTSALIDRDRLDEADWYFVTTANRNRLVLFMNAYYGWYLDEDDGDVLHYDDEEDESTVEPQSESSSPVVTDTSSETYLSNPYSFSLSNQKRKSTKTKVITPPSVNFGSRDCPIDLSENERNISDIDVTLKTRKRRAIESHGPSSKKPRTTQSPKLVAKKNHKQSQCIERIAKFSTSSTIVFGDVVGQYQVCNQYWIQWDTGLNENFDDKQWKEGLQLYSTRKSEDKFEFNEYRELRYGSGDIPMVSSEDSCFTGKCIVQPHLKRRIHYAHEKQTLLEISKMYNVDVEEVIRMNKQRNGYNCIKSSKFTMNSPILIPL